jgi:CheY-like chemotaxis protein
MRELPWGRTVGLIALTGWGQERDREQTAAAGFDAHLVKPVDHADLQRTVARVSELRASRRTSFRAGDDR